MSGSSSDWQRENDRRVGRWMFGAFATLLLFDAVWQASAREDFLLSASVVLMYSLSIYVLPVAAGIGVGVLTKRLLGSHRGNLVLALGFAGFCVTGVVLQGALRALPVIGPAYAEYVEIRWSLDDAREIDWY